MIQQEEVNIWHRGKQHWVPNVLYYILTFVSCKATNRNDSFQIYNPLFLLSGKPRDVIKIESWNIFAKHFFFGLLLHLLSRLRFVYIFYVTYVTFFIYPTKDVKSALKLWKIWKADKHLICTSYEISYLQWTKSSHFESG